MKSVQVFIEEEDTTGVCELAVSKRFTRKLHVSAQEGWPACRQERLGQRRAGVCSEGQDTGLPREKVPSRPHKGQESMWGHAGHRNVK